MAAMALSAGAARCLPAGEAQWPDERTAGAFRCHADFSLDNYADLLGELGRLQDDLSRELGVAAPREEIHLFLFDRRTTYLAYLQQYFPKVPARKALYIKGRGPGMVFAYRSGELEIDVRHEGTHALLHCSMRDIPLWLDEGLAEYYEVPAGERVAKSPYVSSVRWNVRLGYIPDLASLERLRDLSEMGRDEYRDSWAWVHYLLHHSDDARGALTGYLRSLASGEEAGDLSDHLRRRVDLPDDAFANHYRRWQVAA
jgi:hypothetical protein